MKSPKRSDPIVSGMSLTGAVSLIAIGTPANGRSSPASTVSAVSQRAVGIDVDECVQVGLKRLDLSE